MKRAAGFLRAAWKSKALGGAEQPDGCYKQWECLVESVQRMGRGWVAPRGAPSGGVRARGGHAGFLATGPQCPIGARSAFVRLPGSEAGGLLGGGAQWAGGRRESAKASPRGGPGPAGGNFAPARPSASPPPPAHLHVLRMGAQGRGPQTPCLALMQGRGGTTMPTDLRPASSSACPHFGGEFVEYVAGEAPSCPAACTHQPSCQRFACFEPLGFPTPFPHPRVGSHPLVLRFTSAQGASSSRWGGPAWWGVRRAGQQTEACGRDDRRDMARA